jgi:meso-butanediol dehydrogenase/(S,S)-butanediol dehydrogenase/diacetyl reductase
MVESIVETYGQLDILVNNAGAITSQAVEDMSEAEWDNIMNTNIKSVFLGCKAVIPQMKQQGYGRIINIASIAGKIGAPSLAHYCASKFAVVGFTNSLAKALAKEGITVNAICPGIVPTQMWSCLTEAYAEPGESKGETYKRNVELLIPQGVDQTPEDMGEAALFLALSGHITGQAINVCGGAALS